MVAVALRSTDGGEGRRICARCVIDDGVPETTFDADGVCSWCRRFDDRAARHAEGALGREEKLAALVDGIKRAGHGRRYDCVLGVSGGADSSYAALVATRLGLRPLAVHVDNGWNSELAVKNIECVVRGLRLDLVTEVIDWEEFRGLQLSLLRAGVVDLELVSDHAIAAAMFHTARRHRIKHIVTGDNEGTEATLPRGWNHRKTDLANIRAINRAFEGATMRTFPKLSTFGMIFHQRVLRIVSVGLLTWADYVKERAETELADALGWRRYAKKHFESVITRFYQGYILPTKFGIDKRKFHYALLIHSGQMTREAALADLEKPPYDPKLQEEDKIYVCKKLGISIAEFDAMMQSPPRSHYDYATDERALEAGFRALRALRGVRARAGIGR
jgi:N-acetyl sugar amidotransferase